MRDFEQMMNLYHGIFFWCGLAALLFLVMAVVLFIVLKIPQVFGELTGRVAKKAIEEMIEESSESGGLTSRRIGEDGRRHRGRSGASGTLRLRRRTGGLTGGLPTEKMSDGLGLTAQMAAGGANQQPPADSGLYTEPVTSVMDGNRTASETTLMGDPVGASETTLMGGPAGASETTLMGSPADTSETTLLGSGAVGGFAVLRSIVEVHTDEVIV